jgi:MFS family permease
MTDHYASETHTYVRFNATVNILDGAFFGFALGFASFTTVIPLFVSQLTGSAILIGLAGAIHTIGWQVPQLFTATRVRRLSRFKPLVLAMTIHERLPFLGLALLAWSLPNLNTTTALVLLILLLIWQGFGGGYTANVWQSMIAKIIPVSWRGGFFGLQMAAVNLLASITAVAAGWILERYPSPLDFTLCFLLASVGMLISFGFIAQTREVDHKPAISSDVRADLWGDVRRILREDALFRRFLVIRIIFQLAFVAFTYFAVYAVNELGLSVSLVGWLTGLLIFTEVFINPIFGRLGDRRGHCLVLFIGTLAALISTALAGWVTSTLGWFLIFALAGAANVSAWTTTMVISLGFGDPADQATYIGLSNTLLAPATILSPFMAGWSVEVLGYANTFRIAALVFALAAVLSLSLVRRVGMVRSSGC